MADATVAALSCSSGHDFSKQRRSSLELRAGMGVVGDAHFGATVQHRSRVATDPAQPNLRQVHLITAELLDTLSGEGWEIGPGDPIQVSLPPGPHRPLERV